MSDINCSITTDILPLYIDDVVSDGTKAFVEEHLSHCESCRREYEKLSRNTVIADNVSVRLEEAEPLRAFKKRMQRVRMLLVSAALIIFVMMTVPLPLRIHHTLNGIRWESGGELSDECEVTVEGWYYYYILDLIKDNVFKGDITVATANETASYIAPHVTLYHNSMYEGSVRVGTLTVYDPELNQMRPLGNIAVSGSLKEFFIQSQEWNISAPAANHAEAEELAEKLMKNNSF